MRDEPARVRVVLADDHALVLDGLRALLATAPDLEVVAVVRDGESALDAVRRHRADVLVMDLEMPRMTGLDCLRAIRAAALPIRVLILSGYGDPHTLRAAMDADADGYVLKTDSPHTTLAAIRQVAAGQLVFPRAARRWFARGGAPDDRDAPTPREESVLALLAEGKSNAEIAELLGLSESTVKFHLRNLFTKLGVTNRTEASAHFHRRR
jgi:DNA-binding NarL/FixJ family response regulator